MIASVGGLDMVEINDFKSLDPKDFGSPGSVPWLQHGSLKMAQSTAIEHYVSSIAPRFATLTPQMRAKDGQMLSIKEDLVQGFAKHLFGTDKSAWSTEIPKVAEKWFPVIESLLPETGFLNGLAIPTPGDLAINSFLTGMMPFNKVVAGAGYDWKSAFPKLAAYHERVAAAPLVQEYAKTAKFTQGSF